MTRGNGSGLARQVATTVAGTAATMAALKLMKGQKPRKKSSKKAAATRGRPSTVQTAAVAAQRNGKALPRAVISGNPYAADGKMRIKHREYVGDVNIGLGDWALQAITVAAATPTPNKLFVNPGNSQVTPWLANIAVNFQQYKYRRLRFILETEAPTNIGGSIQMAFDSDTTDLAPSSKQQIMQFGNCVREAPWQNVTMDCLAGGSQKALGKDRFVTSATTPTQTDDPKTYFTGVLYIGASGFTAATSSELYIEYDVELWQPITPLLIVNQTYGKTPPANSALSMTVQPGGTVTNANVFGTSPSILQSPPGAIAVSGNSVTLLTPGTYAVQVLVSGSGLSNTSISVSALGTSTAAAFFGPSSGYVQNGGAGIWNFKLTVPSAATGVQGLTINVNSGTVSAASLIFTVIDPAVIPSPA